jgi:nitrite reductase/ring-hydroxylating ferredoxin subunit
MSPALPSIILAQAYGGTVRVDVGTVEELREKGCLTGKAGAQPVCVFWSDGRAYALDDRCPHMGFPLHRGTVEDGLVTCHWHHARFDLSSGGTMNPFADDVRAYPVSIDDGRVVVVVEEAGEAARAAVVAHQRRRLEEGLEQGLTLVTAKATLALLDAGVAAEEVVREGVEFGTTYRDAGWGAGLTVLVAMANVLPSLDPHDRPRALVHGLAFVSRDTRGRPPSFPLRPLGSGDVGPERLVGWYRRFVENRNAAAAERTLLTALEAGMAPDDVARMMTAAATDHVFLDGGHTVDFTNKAFELLDHLGWDGAAAVLPTLVDQTANAARSEEGGRWRHPHDLAALVLQTNRRLAGLALDGPGLAEPEGVAALGRRLLDLEPDQIVDALVEAVEGGATPEQLGRACALAAGLRITRFHTQNDFGDWDVVHHGFTTANAVHQALRRTPSADLLRGVVHGALRVYLDRFLNVPAARLPRLDGGDGEGGGLPDLAGLQPCWDEQGGVDRAGAIAYGWVRGGGDTGPLVAALGRALLSEDAQFHWFQTVEAAVRQAGAWPAGSEEAALLLAGAARFLAAHTPTRRELPHVVRIAARLRRGEELFTES